MHRKQLVDTFGAKAQMEKFKKMKIIWLFLISIVSNLYLKMDGMF
jgi:hypothetical protein